MAIAVIVGASWVALGIIVFTLWGLYHAFLHFTRFLGRLRPETLFPHAKAKSRQV